MLGPKSTPKRTKRKFSLTIENILKECQELENPDFLNMSRYMENQISKISGVYDQIQTNDLNPTKFEASRAYQNGKTRLRAYIKSKYDIKERMNKERLKQLLHDETPKQPLNKLSFNSFRDREISYLVTKNKRGFAEGWKFGGFSAQVSPETSVLPSISSSPQNSPPNAKISINNLISSMIERKLGMAQKQKNLVIRKKSFQKRKTSVNLGPIDFSELGTQLEEKYLNPEFQKYNSNVANKLKIQKLIEEKHIRDRRSIILNPDHFKVKD